MVSIPQAVWIACNDERQSNALAFQVSIPQAVWIACNWRKGLRKSLGISFNTASGMDCMQYCLPEPLKTVNPEIGFLILSRPRDKSKGRRRLANGSYAKTSQEREPRAKRDWLTLTAPPSLFALFPKPRGTFLSQKAVQKGCKASNIKETFVHEENLKLMTSFRKSRTSL